MRSDLGYLAGIRAQRALSEEEADAEWRVIDGAKRTGEEALRRKVRDAFLAQRDRVKERLESGDWIEGRAEEPLTASAVFDVEDAVREMLDLTEEQMLQLLQIGWETGMLRIEQDQVYDQDAPWVRGALRRLNGQMQQVNRNTLKVINSIIIQGQNDASKSVDDIADDIVSRMERMASGTGGPDQPGSVTQSRARRVAATSATTAFETAQDRAWRSQGVEASSWLSQRDGRVSEGHFEADGQRRDLGQPFDVRRTFDRLKEELMHPGDPQGRASNIVNCRCSRRPLLDRDTE